MHLYGGVGKAQRSTSGISFQVHVFLLCLKQCLPLESGAHWPNSACWLTSPKSLPVPFLLALELGVLTTTLDINSGERFTPELSLRLSPCCVVLHLPSSTFVPDYASQK